MNFPKVLGDRNAALTSERSIKLLSSSAPREASIKAAVHFILQTARNAIVHSGEPSHAIATRSPSLTPDDKSLSAYSATFENTSP